MGKTHTISSFELRLTRAAIRLFFAPQRSNSYASSQENNRIARTYAPHKPKEDIV